MVQNCTFFLVDMQIGQNHTTFGLTLRMFPRLIGPPKAGNGQTRTGWFDQFESVQSQFNTNDHFYGLFLWTIFMDHK